MLIRFLFIRNSAEVGNQLVSLPYSRRLVYVNMVVFSKEERTLIF